MDVLRVIEGAHDRAATVGIHQENRSIWTKAIVGHVFDACSNGFGIASSVPRASNAVW
jgi:hypothetical protein